MTGMGSWRWLRLFAIALGIVGLTSATRLAWAQDRVVGREALDPGDQENLGPAVDGRTDSPEEADPRALEEFEEPLAPHGTWVDDGEYGTVWVPHAHEVGADFYPYSSGGHWELTAESDWLWVSDYSWGYIPFHYGRWVWIDGRGWAWIPGRVWAPAWVVWRTGPYGYIGWAPCPPTWTWWGGSAVWLWWPPPAAYVFVETRYVFHRQVHHHHVRDRQRAHNAAAHTRPERDPARPGAPRHDRSRPKSPDLNDIRYDGPTPPRSPRQTYPDLGLSGRSSSGIRPDGSRLPTSRSGLTPRDQGGRFAPPSQRDRWGRVPKASRGAPSQGPARGQVRAAPRPGRAPGAPAVRPQSSPSPAPRPAESAPVDRRPRPDAVEVAPRMDAPRPSAPVQSAPSTGALKPAPRPSVSAPPKVVPRPAPAPRRGRVR